METGNGTQTHPCSSFGDIPTRAVICYLFYLCFSLLAAVTVGGNLLVLVSVSYFRKLHTPTNSLLLSLAVCDLLVGAVVFPLSMRFPESTCRRFYNSFCKARGIFDLSLCICSILHLCGISVDRYLAVCHPMTYRNKINIHVVGGMILLFWSVPAGIGTLFLLAESQLVMSLEANIAGLIFSFYLPVLIIIVIYLKIFLVADRQARSIQKLTSVKRSASNRLERRSTRTLAIVMGVFLLCWLPFFLCTTVRVFSDVVLPMLMVETLNWLALCNSMLNPFIYAFFYSWFRVAVKIIVSGQFFRQDMKNSPLMNHVT